MGMRKVLDADFEAERVAPLLRVAARLWIDRYGDGDGFLAYAEELLAEEAPE